jgi:hypothetical protein
MLKAPTYANSIEERSSDLHQLPPLNVLHATSLGGTTALEVFPTDETGVDVNVGEGDGAEFFEIGWMRLPKRATDLKPVEPFLATDMNSLESFRKVIEKVDSPK